jgi:hypothetical protein
MYWDILYNHSLSSPKTLCIFIDIRMYQKKRLKEPSTKYTENRHCDQRINLPYRFDK